MIENTLDIGVAIEAPPTKTTKEFRVAWRLGQQTGTGLWFPAAQEKIVRDAVADANSRYGAGTHRVEERTA